MVYILCGECGEALYTRTEPLKSGDAVLSKDFTALPGIPEPKTLDRFVCPRCEASLHYMRQEDLG